GEPVDELPECLTGRGRLEEAIRQAAGGHGAERVAVATRILGGDQPELPCNSNLNGTALVEQGSRKRLVILPAPRVAPRTQLVGQLVRRARRPAQLALDILDRLRIEQVAQLLLPEQLAQQVAVERERLRTPLGGRRVVLVHVRRDVVEEE